MSESLEGLRDQEPAPLLLVPRSIASATACSKAAYRFQLQHHRIFDFFFFGLGLVTFVDKGRFNAAKALAGAGGSEQDKARFEAVKNDPEPTFRKLISFSGYQSEIMVIRSVDNFMSFLSETLQACMFKKPELLRSKEQIKTEDALRFSNRRDFVDFLVSRKLNELSYGGLRGIEEFFDQRISVPLIESEQERTALSVAIELRNLYTHNRGVVSELFLSRLHGKTQGYDFVMGKRFHADFDEIVRLGNNLFDIAIRLDSTILKKFGVERKRFTTWDGPRIREIREAPQNNSAEKPKWATD